LAYPDFFLQSKLDARAADSALRRLQVRGDLIDFCSNDYLGMVHGKKIQLPEGKDYAHGSTGSRLLAGHSKLAEEVEEEIAAFHEGAAALVFNSGYDANIGLLSAIPQKGDTILYDQLSHASLRDGIRLSFANSYGYAHNDLNVLEQKLKQATGQIFVVTESVFSMDGDMAPIQDMISLCERYGAHLIVDEAHGIGLIGDRGEGLVQSLGVQDSIFARIYTYGKAPGVHGAAVVGSKRLKDYLINFARSFVYTTALPEVSLAAIRESYKIFPTMMEERKQLGKLVAQFQAEEIIYQKLKSNTAIQGVVIPGNDAVGRLAYQLQAAGLDVRAIRYPTVPNGAERLRIVLHAYNTEEEVKLMGKAINEFEI
jgi:8-amino-7-oxononanoate synthase